MKPARPLIGLPADRRMIGPHPFHAVVEKYARAVLDAAGGLPLLIPSLAEELRLDELVERLDGLLFTGSPSNVEPHHYEGPPSEPGTVHDPARDATTSAFMRFPGISIIGTMRVSRSRFSMDPRTTSFWHREGCCARSPRPIGCESTPCTGRASRDSARVSPSRR